MRALTAFVALQLLALTGTAQTVSAPDFAYSGDKGPGFWYEIADACRTTPTSHQSPVDIRNTTPDVTLKALHLIVSGADYVLKNSGYTVVATPQSLETLLFDGSTYDLAEFHVHTLSEHTIAGKRGVMELHAVFRDSRKKYVVIGVIYRIGHRNRFLSDVLRAGLPLKSKSEPISVGWLNIQDALTDTARYYTYPGSFTTPNCNEDVTWVVLKQWAEMSKEQFEAFRNVLGNDFRPLQELNDRVVRETANGPAPD